MSSVLSNMQFGKVKPGMVRLSMDGKIAVKVGDSYKTYNPKTKRLVNCDQFVFNVGEDFFFVMPTNKVKVGDIILVNDLPAYVLKPETDGEIKILNFLDASIKTILPERHTFLGGSYMYSKIVSMFGTKGFDKNTIMKYMMMNTMFGGSTSGNPFASASTGMNPMMMMMMMGGKNPMAEMFNFGDEGEELFGNVLDLDAADDEDDFDEDIEDDDDEGVEVKPKKEKASKKVIRG